MKFGDKHFEAADLIARAYEGKLDAPHQLDQDGVQAFVTADRILVIPGTNEPSDWFRFNFKVGRGVTRAWHQGFLDHSRVVYDFAKSLNPRLIVGHSLGAASAQIVGYSLHVDTIAFASPKPLRYLPQMPSHGFAWVQNICREDDMVCALPPNFLHVGKVEWLTPKRHHWGEDHRIDNYIAVMKEANKG